MTLADMRSVEDVIQTRLAAGRWVVSPSIASKALQWPLARAAGALAELHHTDSYRLVLHLSAICDHCHALNRISAGEDDLVNGGELHLECRICQQAYSATLDNTIVEYHIHSTHRTPDAARKESTSEPAKDARR